MQCERDTVKERKRFCSKEIGPSVYGGLCQILSVLVVLCRSGNIPPGTCFLHPRRKGLG